jgi:hypothetical protein
VGDGITEASVVPGVIVGETLFGEIDGGDGRTIFLASHANLPIDTMENVVNWGVRQHYCMHGCSI